MAPRSTKDIKLARDNSRGYRTRHDQTFSAPKGSISRFGFQRSAQPVDEPTGILRMYAAKRNRNAPITLAPMPWDKEK